MQAQLFRGEGGIGPHPQLVVWEAGGREPRDVKARGTGAWGRKGTAARARAREGSGVRARVAPSGGALTPKPPPPPYPLPRTQPQAPASVCSWCPRLTLPQLQITCPQSSQGRVGKTALKVTVPGA